LADQEAAGSEGVIADHLGVHAVTRRPAEVAVVAVLFKGVLSHRVRLAIGRRRDHQLKEFMHVPARFAELDGEPIEQFGVARQFSRDAEATAGLNDALAEYLLPKTIDGDARRPREPLREAEAIARQIGGHWRQYGGRVGFHLVATLVIFAAEEYVGYRLGLALAHDVGDGAARLHGDFFLLEHRQFAVQIAVRL